MQTVVHCGKWEFTDINGNKKSYFQLSKNYIKPKYYKEYNEAVELYDELIKNKNNND